MVVECEQEVDVESRPQWRPESDQLGSTQSAQLLAAIARGDRTAWARLYDAYSERLWRFVARLLGGDAAWVADVVQETFLAAARSAAQFDATRGTAWSWLMGIAHRQVALSWRQRGQDQRLQAVLVSMPREVLYGARVFDDSAPADEWFERHELALVIRSTLSALPNEYATVLVAKYLDDQAIDDIAEEWGESYEAIRSRLARARREFKSVFERLTGEAGEPGKDGS